MKRIADLCEEIKEELCDAKRYAEDYLYFKAAGENKKSSHREKMASDELQHAMWLHDDVVEEIETLRKVYTPPQEMLEKWEHDHAEYIEKAAWIKTMLEM